MMQSVCTMQLHLHHSKINNLSQTKGQDFVQFQTTSQDINSEEQGNVKLCLPLVI